MSRLSCYALRLAPGMFWARVFCGWWIVMDGVVLQVLVEEGGQLPSYGSAEAAGMDLRCVEEVVLGPGERALVRTGLRMAIPKGFEGQVRPRSGLALKHGIGCVNSPGTIDSDYRGEVGVILVNWGQETVRLAAGERIAQLVIAPVVRAQIAQVGDLDETERGGGGFGSTGTH